jgi:putative intracellular protease/amidase
LLQYGGACLRRPGAGFNSAETGRKIGGQKNEEQLAPSSERAACGGLSVNPRYTWADCPPVEILLVPGGWGTRAEMNNGPLLDWIRRTAGGA